MLTSIPIRIAVLLAMIGTAFAGGWIARGSAIQKDTIDAYQKRDKIDAKVDGRTDYQLCIDVGGMPDKCNELRRLAPTTKGK